MFTILFSYNRRRELLRLLRWAQHNGLKHPYRLYHFRWQAEEVRLSRASVQHPHLCFLARVIHTVNGLVFPPPRYPRQGSASGYRHR
jgi:hypothetical protein